MRWGTQESGAAFDRKKTPYLTAQAQAFIVQRALCVVAGQGPQQEPCGHLLTGKPGFVEVADAQTCLLPLDRQLETSHLVQGLLQKQAQASDPPTFLALCFICHATRERLCVQGSVEMLPWDSPRQKWIRLHVRQAFFHCPKYIRTKVAGLIAPASSCPRQNSLLPGRLRYGQSYLSEALCTFIAKQVFCFLCTVDRHGQGAVNHRGGAAGYLITRPPDRAFPGGLILMPDYAGNGAFEAIGNILETGQAALLLPDYEHHLALCISGQAGILAPEDLPLPLKQKCRGAERILVLDVRYVEEQVGDWSSALMYERAYAQAITTTQQPAISQR